MLSKRKKMGIREREETFFHLIKLGGLVKKGTFTPSTLKKGNFVLCLKEGGREKRLTIKKS
jgi:hypothetical protein